jgi:hypothetical protein
LYDPNATAKTVYDAVSAFRTELKVEVGSREVSEVEIQFAPSADRQRREESEKAART